MGSQCWVVGVVGMVGVYGEENPLQSLDAGLALLFLCCLALAKSFYLPGICSLLMNQEHIWGRPASSEMQRKLIYFYFCV